MQLTGNTILITGATSGIGLSLATRWHEAGNTVIATGRRKDRLDAITAEHPGIETLVLDVDEPASIAACAETVAHRFPRLNVLVNNAGVMRPESLRGVGDLPIAEAAVTTNLLGPIRMCETFVPLLVGQENPVVLNVSAALAFVPLPAAPTASATKAALRSYTQSLRVHLRRLGIQVIELIPPAVRTRLMGQAESEEAVPVEQFVTSALALIAGHPDAEEVCVDEARFLRSAEAEGRYDRTFALLSRSVRD
ncbi:SDR family NAD(P)-dependent oxidoreductase [Amycolatopsis sp. PS_44_ISF1]|uniref:SDR family oxidoreductase n=1 Tax=Amycolatopsis sp. PS_44_ISF1 TaxID=2974917 RepID=UPI0028DDFEB0|nr:SDR family NAD(P)-dependent oxidoreductase [Amycolatopsis sp. PS_44_ISF1]MDT8913501.1 SDR family NAD(P)-dependent oxidoreductase [Amycolatopsis sp. PS_44_ISF1]